MQRLDWIDFLWYMTALIGAALVMFVTAAYLRYVLLQIVCVTWRHIIS